MYKDNEHKDEATAKIATREPFQNKTTPIPLTESERIQEVEGNSERVSTKSPDVALPWYVKLSRSASTK